jgi:hypothetical protein
VHSLVNIVKRKNHNGDSYYQARFFEKDGPLHTAKSYPGVQSRTEVYRLARNRATLISVKLISVALEDSSIVLSSLRPEEIKT